MNEWFSLETCHPSHSWQAFYFRDFCSTCLSNAIHWEFHMVFYPDGAQDKKMAFWHAGKLGCQKPSQFTVLFIIQWLARELIAVSWAPGWWYEGADFKQKLESALGKESAVVGRRGLKSEKFLSPALALQPWTSLFTSLGLSAYWFYKWQTQTVISVSQIWLCPRIFRKAFYSFYIFWPNSWHSKVFRPGIKLAPQQWPEPR